jgi:hypothetical protein
MRLCDTEKKFINFFKTQRNYLIDCLIFSLHICMYSAVHFNDFKKYSTLQALLEEEENQIRGFTYIFDCSGLTLSHLAIWTPSGIGQTIIEATLMYSIFLAFYSHNWTSGHLKVLATLKGTFSQYSC